MYSRYLPFPISTFYSNMKVFASVHGYLVHENILVFYIFRSISYMNHLIKLIEFFYFLNRTD
jgi:hypothetical protein